MKASERQRRISEMTDRVVACRQTLKSCSVDADPKAWVEALIDLGLACVQLAQEVPAADRGDLVEYAMAALFQACEDRAKVSRFDRDLELYLGIGQVCLLAGDYGRAAEAFRRVLLASSLDDTPLQWAEANRGLGIAILRALPSTSVGDAHQAEVSFCGALVVFGRDEHPRRWAECQRYLGLAYLQTPDAYRDESDVRLAIQALRRSLEVLSREEDPAEWAGAMADLGVALQEWTGLQRDTEVLRDAVESFSEAATVFEGAGLQEERRRLLLDWGLALLQLARDRRELPLATQAQEILNEYAQWKESQRPYPLQEARYGRVLANESRELVGRLGGQPRED